MQLPIVDHAVFSLRGVASYLDQSLETAISSTTMSLLKMAAE